MLHLTTSALASAGQIIIFFIYIFKGQCSGSIGAGHYHENGEMFLHNTEKLEIVLAVIVLFIDFDDHAQKRDFFLESLDK